MLTTSLTDLELLAISLALSLQTRFEHRNKFGSEASARHPQQNVETTIPTDVRAVANETAFELNGSQICDAFAVL